ncbi:MAG: hypothetical protein KY439_11930 [Actinobacteria bacterium]|nr:hypothetical protein [Actinomycetota bacterium]
MWPRDVARRSDIDSLDAEISGLDAKLDATQRLLVERFEHTEAHLVGVMRGGAQRPDQEPEFGFVGLQATIGAFVVGFVRFAV